MAHKIQSLHVEQQDNQSRQQHRTVTGGSRYPQTVEHLLQSTQSQIFLMQVRDEVLYFKHALVKQRDFQKFKLHFLIEGIYNVNRKMKTI